MKRDLTGLALDCAAAYRITRFITKDSLLVNVRDDIIRKAYKASQTPFEATQVTAPGDWAVLAEADPDAPKLATLITCRWCTGVYVAAGVMVARSVMPSRWDWMARLLTIASAAALIARLEKS